MSTETPATPRLRTDDVMAEVRARVREELSGRVRDAELVDRLEALFLDATTVDDPSRLVLPALLTEPWRPELTVRITSHRAGWAGRAIVSIKERLLLPLNRWLFEYALGNFRRQDRLNLTMLACLERLAAENLQLRREVARLAGVPTASASSPAASHAASDRDTSASAAGSDSASAPSA